MLNVVSSYKLCQSSSVRSPDLSPKDVLLGHWVSASLQAVFLQVATDIATIKQALVASNLMNVSLHSPYSSSTQAFSSLMAVLHTQKLSNQAVSTVQQQSGQDHSRGSQPTSESHQAQESVAQLPDMAQLADMAQLPAHHSDVVLPSAVELESCASELLHAISFLSNTLSQHQGIEDACAGSINKAIIQALSDQVGLVRFLTNMTLTWNHVLPCVERLLWNNCADWTLLAWIDCAVS